MMSGCQPPYQVYEIWNFVVILSQSSKSINYKIYPRTLDAVHSFQRKSKNQNQNENQYRSLEINGA